MKTTSGRVQTGHRIGLCALLPVACGVLLYVTACTGGGGNSLAGAATIRGNVVSFEGQKTRTNRALPATPGPRDPAVVHRLAFPQLGILNDAQSPEETLIAF
ncbi:MAG: hypothetical protein O2923_11615 [Verrucomicrobia bacterium]|nr:hypothetical protein [Verrucomicrobiota bacterium]MDA1086223.1 hypothetical protein [Verrucomicrobiota bacterium]